MFGDSPLDRFAGLAADYDTWPTAPNAIVIGAESAGHLVGIAAATLSRNWHAAVHISLVTSGHMPTSRPSLPSPSFTGAASDGWS